MRVLAPKLPPTSEYAGPQAGPNWATLHTQFVPGGAQGAGPGFPCQNGVLRKWPRGLPHPRWWLDIIFGSGGPGGQGRGSRKSLNFGRKSSILCEEHRVHGLGIPFLRLVLQIITFKSCQWYALEQSSKFKRADSWAVSLSFAHYDATPAFQTIKLDRECLKSILKGSWHSGDGQKASFQGFQKCNIFAQQTGPRTNGQISTPFFCFNGYGLTLKLSENKRIGEIRTKTCISTPIPP